MNTKRRILYDEPGQTCNLFWSYLESVSWAILNRKKVHILWWDSSIRNYDALRHSRFTRFPFFCPVLIKVIGEARYKRLLKRVFDCERARSFYVSSRGVRLGFVQGWTTRESDVYFPLVKKEALSMFSPNQDIQDRVHAAISKARVSYGILIGIHMRRGDYKNWRDGRYYYSLSQYDSFMSQIESLFPGKQVGFYIATNEDLEAHKGELRNNEFHGIGGAAEDLLALSECDYIAGPPSTFSKWASIYGHTPLHIIYDADDNISSLDLFSPLMTHTKFENGTIVW